MDKRNFISEFEEIVMVEPGTIDETTILNELEDWDSLTKMSFEVFVEDNFGIKLELNTINKFNDFGDILEVLKEKLS